METETTEVQAGRELDELVAERVMGWTRPVELPAHMQGYASYDPALLSKMRDRRHWWHDAEGNAGTVPNYSTDMAAAWQVVEKLAERHINTAVIWKGRGQRGCIVTCDGLSGFASQGEAPTPPLAICRAALEATRAS